MWLVATILDNADKAHFHHCRKSYWTVWVDSGCLLAFLAGHNELFLRPLWERVELGEASPANLLNSGTQRSLEQRGALSAPVY